MASLGVLSLPVSGCSKADPATDAGVEEDGGFVLTCQNDSRVEAWAPNLSFASSDGAMKVTLLQSTPAPPAQGLNSWSIKVTDGSGNPLPNLSLQLVPYMPDHHHGPSVTPEITSNGDGTYSITNIDYFMPGVWQNTLQDGTSESAVIDFCISG